MGQKQNERLGQPVGIEWQNQRGLGLTIEFLWMIGPHMCTTPSIQHTKMLE